MDISFTNEVLSLVKVAGEKLLEIYAQDFNVIIKDDKSPVTIADYAANAIITEGLARITPNIPIITEENDNPPLSTRQNFDLYWMVDPLDGTKEFIKKNDQFTINIALMRGKYPIWGCIYAPVLKDCYYGGPDYGAHKNGNLIKTRAPSGNNLTVVVSRSHITTQTQEVIDSLKTSYRVTQLAVGSALKMCMIAEGSADYYPRLGPTSEWDTAAGQAICEAAGAKFYNFNTKERLSYNDKENFLNPYFAISATILL